MVPFALSIWFWASFIALFASRSSCPAKALCVCLQWAADLELLSGRLPSSFPIIKFQEEEPNNVAGSYSYDDTTSYQSRREGKERVDRSRQTPCRRAREFDIKAAGETRLGNAHSNDGLFFPSFSSRFTTMCNP